MAQPFVGIPGPKDGALRPEQSDFMASLQVEMSQCGAVASDQSGESSQNRMELVELVDRHQISTELEDVGQFLGAKPVRRTIFSHPDHGAERLGRPDPYPLPNLMDCLPMDVDRRSFRGPVGAAL